MNPVFEVDVWNMAGPDATYATLRLPATSYEIMDTMERINVSNIGDAAVTISEYMEFETELADMKQPLHLGQLNALAERISQMNQLESIVFEGLCQMEKAKGQGGIELCRAIDLAYSTECCHAVPTVLNDSQLGRFYAENGFFTELDSLPDEMFELLDFERIGAKMRKGEGGVFTTRGYVTQHTELNQVADRMNFTVQPPGYVFRVGIVNCMRDDSDPRKVAYLKLPATEEQLNEFPRKLGLEDWMGTAMYSLDGPLPDFDRAIISKDELPELNSLAKRIQTIAARGKLPKYKAVLSAERCQDIDEALFLADALDAYYYTPSQRTLEEVGREELRFLMDHDAAELAMQHMNLTTYGKAVMERHHSVLTDYGAVERKDGQPIHRQEPEPPTFQLSM